MNKNDFERLTNSFAIRDIKVEEESYYSDYDIDWTSISATNIPNKIKIETRPVVTLKVDQSFLYFLMDFLEYKDRIDRYEGMSYPNIEKLHKYFKDRYEKWYAEDVLQKKYPELQDIMRDYEVTKALIIESLKK